MKPELKLRFGIVGIFTGGFLIGHFFIFDMPIWASILCNIMFVLLALAGKDLVLKTAERGFIKITLSEKEAK